MDFKEIVLKERTIHVCTYFRNNNKKAFNGWTNRRLKKEFSLFEFLQPKAIKSHKQRINSKKSKIISINLLMHSSLK